MAQYMRNNICLSKTPKDTVIDPTMCFLVIRQLSQVLDQPDVGPGESGVGQKRVHCLQLSKGELNENDFG